MHTLKDLDRRVSISAEEPQAQMTFSIDWLQGVDHLLGIFIENVLPLQAAAPQCLGAPRCPDCPPGHLPRRLGWLHSPQFHLTLRFTMEL